MTDEGPTPMETDEPEKELKQNAVNAPSMQYMDIQPSAPPDTVKVKVILDWKEPLPGKWRKHYHTALQSWCNLDLSRDIGTCEICRFDLMESDPLCAEVQITPSKAREVLIKNPSATLTFKDPNVSVTASFLVEGIMSDWRDPSPKMNSSLPFASANNGVGVSAAKIAEMTPETSSAACSVPLHLYWFIHHAYRNELEQIEKKHGVKLHADVSVSFENTPNTNPILLSKASEELLRLVQRCGADFSSVTIPCNTIDSDIVREAMRCSQLEDNKMTMSFSPNNVQVFGSKGPIEKIDRFVNGTRPEGQTTGNKVTNVYTQITHPLDMDMNDLQNQIEMDKVYWDLMNRCYKEQLIILQTKFGVLFQTEELKDNLIKVRAQSKDNQHNDLKNHAMRALMQHYQKLALATVSCELKDLKDTDTVAKIKEILVKQQYCVAAVDVYGPWRLVGLPEHLGPSMKDIEKEIGKSVFDEETKKLIGYSGDVPPRRGYTLTYEHGAAGGSTQHETDPGFSGEGEEENCVICIDRITNKKKLECGHEFCKECIEKSIKHSGCICPVCKKVFGKIEGNQPKGTMTSKKYSQPLPGYSNNGTIEINYYIPSGIQTSKHPNPGQHFQGAQRTAYLPDNEEGNHVHKLLKRAFEQKLIFTVGTSTTSGATNVVTWNDIHHKTSISGGPQSYGYPDQDYLKRVKEELKAKGIE